MSRYLSDSIPAKAFVVLDKKGKRIANVVIKYPKDGAGIVRAQCLTWDDNGHFHKQDGKAGGYGYDKAAAAIAGFKIDGHILADHCGRVEPEAMRKAANLLKRHQAGKFPKDPLAEDHYQQLDKAAKKLGFRFSNWQTIEKHSKGGCYLSIYPLPGLERLEALGYNVVQAL